MATLLKYLYNKKLIDTLSREICQHDRKFDAKGFKSTVFDTHWDNKELKQRMRHITESLHQHLPKNYRQALKILKPASEKFQGFEPMFFPDYVEQYGLEDYDASIQALEHFTKYSSSEFAVRPFIIKHGKKMMSQMEQWANSDNHHVRRLASEGCRPRLPWAQALPEFKRNPKPVIKILKKLKSDDSEYVRRSVANNLNDISKDHPQAVLQIAQDWLGNHADTDWIVKHACRTLLKQGNPKTMRLFGFSSPKHIQLTDFDVQQMVKKGGALKFSFAVNTTKKNLGKLRVEYAIDFMKSNGQRKRKVFSISESKCLETKKTISKSHSFKPISTRKYYPGVHGLAVLINGQEMAQDQFLLKK